MSRTDLFLRAGRGTITRESRIASSSTPPCRRRRQCGRVTAALVVARATVRRAIAVLAPAGPGPAGTAALVAACLAAMPGLAGAVPPPVDEPVSMRASAWLGACDNLRDCTLFGFADDDSAVLTLRLPRGRDPSGTLLLRPDRPLRAGMAVRLQAGRRGAVLPVRMDDSAGPGQVRGVLDPSTLRALLPALRQTGRVLVTVAPARSQNRGALFGNVKLAGASTVLDWIARTQRRPPSPVAPIASAPPPDPSSPPPPDALPAAVAALPGVRACLGEDSGSPGQGAAGVVLSQRVVLWRIPCGSGNFSQDSLFVLADGPRDPVAAGFNSPPQFPARPPGILVNAEMDADRTLTSTEPSRGLDDCGDLRRYRWDGARFRLAQARLMTACHGLPPEEWPLVYRAGPEGGEP